MPFLCLEDYLTGSVNDANTRGVLHETRSRVVRLLQVGATTGLLGSARLGVVTHANAKCRAFTKETCSTSIFDADIPGDES